MIAEKSAPLGVKATLGSAHGACVDREAAAFARLDADTAALFETEDGREGCARSSSGARRDSSAAESPARSIVV
jgi:hypothetical protein